MNKIKEIRKQLNLSQIDLAIILQTTRTQLSMFELGQRDLPTKSKLLLAEIVQFIQEEEEEKEDSKQIEAIRKEETAQTKKALEAMLQNNTFQQLLLEKKIKAAEKKYRNAITSLHLSEYLEKNNDKLNKNMAQVIRNGAVSNLKTINQALLTQYQIKMEVLKAEEKILIERLKKQ